MTPILANILLSTLAGVVLLIITGKAAAHGATDAQAFVLLAVAVTVPALFAVDAAGILCNQVGIEPLGAGISWVLAVAAFIVAARWQIPLAKQAALPQLRRPSRRRFGLELPKIAQPSA